MPKEPKHKKLPRFYFSFIVLWLRYTGIELLKREESLRYKMFSACVALYAITFTLLECLELKFHSDFDEISVIIWYITIHVLTLAKTALLYKNRKQFGEVMQSFHEGLYRPDNKEDDKFEEQCVCRILDRCRSQATRYILTMVLAVTAGFTLSLKSRIFKTRENWILPFISMSFVDISHSPIFEIMYIYQAIACYVLLAYCILADYTVISIIAQTIAQLQILSHRIRNYQLRFTQLASGKNKASVHKIFQENVAHHVSILNTVERIEDVTSYMILCVFLADLILLCSAMYNASMISVLSTEFARYLGYSAMVGVPLFLYCWWGNEMTLTNEALAGGIFEAYEADIPIVYAKTLKLMMQIAQRPLSFTAGNFAPLSLETFKAIVKGSFSYYTVLRQINSK